MSLAPLPSLAPTLKLSLTVVLWCCLAFYSFELAAKLWLRPISDRGLVYPLSVSGAIDLLAVVPIPLALLLGVQTDIAWLLSVVWLLKIAVFVPGLAMLGRVIALESRALTSVSAIFLIILMMSAVALYVLEHSVQPEQFGSFPRSLWWAVTTLTTTGYGDSVPVTFLGRVIAGMVMICGLGVFGLWTGIMATGFAAEHRRRDFIRNWDHVTRVPFFRNLQPTAVIELTRMLRRLDVPEKAVVVRRGRHGDCMYFVAAGEVEVKLDPKSVRLGPGAFFGEMALLKGGRRVATVVATMPTTLLVLDVSDFRAFTTIHPELAHAVEAEASLRASGAQNQASD
jgi:voltage-gated potassium channel